MLDIVDLLNRILLTLNELKAVNQDRLWTKQDLLNYFGVGLTTLDSSIISHVTFPKAVKASQSMRWIPEEVKTWASRNRF